MQVSDIVVLGKENKHHLTNIAPGASLFVKNSEKHFKIKSSLFVISEYIESTRISLIKNKKLTLFQLYESFYFLSKKIKNHTMPYVV